MPLCQGAVGECGRRAERVADLGEDLTGDVALEQPQDLFAAGTGGGTAGGVRAGLWVVHEPVVGDDPQGAVGGAVAAAVEAVALGLAAGMLDRAGATQRRERALAAEPVRVVAGGHQQLRGADRADPGPGQEPWHDPPHDDGDVLVVVADLLVEVLPAACQRPQRQAGAVGAGQGGAGGGQLDDAPTVDASTLVVVEFEDEAAQLLLGLGAGLDGAAACHQQGAQLPGRAAAVLGGGGGVTGQHRTGGGLGVDGVGLATPASRDTVGPVAEAARALPPGLDDLAEVAGPRPQPGVVGVVGAEGRHPQAAADLVEGDR